MFVVHSFHIITQRFWFLLKRPDKFSNRNIGFAPALKLLTDIYSIWLFSYNLILIVEAALNFLTLIKLELEEKVLYRLLQMLLFDLQQH